jgi:geranylgeranyl diphosphate synthase type II
LSSLVEQPQEEQPQNRKTEAPDPSGGLGNLASHKELLEEYLEGLVFSKDQRLAVLVEAMRYALLAGGKRIRPVLCMEVARTFGGEPAGVLPSAAAIELIHTFSLIHDDLPAMDDDDFRRGRPTVHKRYGEAGAILAGDAFFGESLSLVTVRQKGTAEQVLEVVRELARATGVDGMVGGQLLDLGHTGTEIEPETLEAMHACKTGALLMASARIGAILAGARGEDLAAISEYARHLGLCFQIVDDILDATATTEALGKSAGSDEAQGNATFFSVYGPDRARRLADGSLRRALRALERTKPDTHNLAGLARFVRWRGH